VDPLPFVDGHRIQVGAAPERTWEAVRQLVGRLGRSAPATFVALWHLEPPSGFAVAEETAPVRLVLRGRHRFSRYELAFAVAPAGGGTAVSARTSAVFPGIAGRAYRAIVVGSGGHRIVVRRMLARIARAAERAPPRRNDE
jgi:hypothetical protein